MRFKGGDLVRVTDTISIDEGCEWLCPGMVGEIKQCDGKWVNLVQRCVVTYWRVKIGSSHFTIAENILELVPPPDDGRQVVDWDWRTLLKVGA